MEQSMEKERSRVSLFQCLRAYSSATVGMDEIVRLIRYDEAVKNKTEAYRRMATAIGKKKADEEVKERMMPAFSVGVLFDGNGRQAQHVLGFTGLALCDIDSLTPVPSPKGEGSNYSAVDVAFEKAKADPHTLLVYRTISGKGLRILYMYTREDIGEEVSTPLSPARGVGGEASWPAAFLKGNRYFAELVGHEYDGQCSDYTRLSGLAHDEEVYVNMDAEPFVVSDEEILEANFNTKNERGKARKEYDTDSFSVEVEQAWQKVEQTLAKRQLTYQAGRHHDYVMHAAFLFNRYGVDLDELLQWAAQQWADYDSRQREATIRSCYRRTAEHGTWRLNVNGRRGKETSMITLPEIREWLRQHVEVIYNVVTDISMWRLVGHASERAIKGKEDAATLGSVAHYEWQQLDERVVCSIRSQMAADTGKRVLKSDVTDVLHSDFARLVHPVRDYVEGLPPWDGKDRVKELCGHVVGCEEWALHKWLVAMVATWMSDQVCNHEILVLIGRQGIYKTTFFRHLLPPSLRQYFWENAHNSFASKDDHIALSENCLVEIEEIDMSNPKDISELKALATSQTVKERRPYARYREEKKRLASFCATGNQERFLSDDTGNRRWLCFKVEHIDDPHLWTLDYGQLYAQLRDEWRQGFRYWFDADEQRMVERQNQAFRIESDEEQLIRTRLRQPQPNEKVTLMNAASICQFINGGVVGRGLSSRRVSLAMGKLGFKSVHTKRGNFYEVYQTPANEIQPTLAVMDDEPEGNSPANAEWKESELPF